MDTVKYEYYSRVNSKKIEWLWYPYIPYGKLTMLQGDPGEGKSTFILNIIALVTRGKNMPDGYEGSEPKVVIYQCAEDSPEDTIKPRLIQAGADCEKIAFIIDENESLTLDDVRIEEVIKKLGARLFVIDPIQAFIPPDSDMLSATKMRTVLRKLSRVAERHCCAIVLIGHMNKGNGNKNLYRGLGSIDIAAIARSILMISRDSTNPEIRYMFPIKSSLAPEGQAIAFSFKPEGGLLWQGKYDINTSDFTEKVEVKFSKQERAKHIIIKLLREDDKLAREIYDELKKYDVQSRTVELVKKEIGIVTYKSGRTWYWSLPK